MNIRSLFLHLHWMLSAQFGLDLIKLVRSTMGLPRYLHHFYKFRSGYTGKLDLVPCLHDWYEEGGTTKNEYFWQDLFVARMIFANKPEKHVDIGSRVDGFVAHIASFREVEIFDIREITSIIPNITFRQADLMRSMTEFNEYCDSLSCLHALEHFGLGRYGDPINVDGYKQGLKNLSELVKKGGIFYLSTPVGIEKVCFNAHRIFNPIEIKKLMSDSGLELQKLSWFNVENGITDSSDIDNDILRLSKLPYTLAIFTFRKLK